ncbi:MAG TPA: molybdopterin cofactor-binding domain-containing protein [Gemmataceae bacterium]|jgi:isoquinoline 1-oxidoreductase
MTTPTADHLAIDPERYGEAESFFEFEQSRREFFGIAGAGVIVALLMADECAAQRQPGRLQPGGAAPRQIGAWIHIGEKSEITVYTGKVEIGQNIRTSLSQVVAEELHVALGSIRVVMADTAAVPFDMGTFGSRTTPTMAPQLRRAAAAARAVLIELAAEKSKLKPVSFTVADGKVSGPQGQPTYTFGELTRGQKLMKVIAAGVPTASANKWTVAGTSVPKVDGRAFVTGSHRYASDTHRPGMLFGKVLRPPAFQTQLASVNAKAAEKKAGLTVVRDGDFVGIVGPTESAAAEGLTLIEATWKATPKQVGSQDLFKHLKETAGRGGGGGRLGGGGGTQGSIDAGIKAADQTIKATYTIAYIAHVPLEPRAAVAEWQDGKVTVWTGTQRPFGVRGEVAAALGIPTDRVRIIVPDMGSGYGGKHSGEAAVEAARLAKSAGKPVKIVWTREEEFTWAYFRPAGLIEVNAGAKKDGTLTAWDFHNYNSGASAIRTPYAAPNVRTAFHSSNSPLRQGAYRALASSANTFARESVMDELAHAVGIDSLEFRLKNLKDARLRAVLEAAAKQFGWGRAKPEPNRGFGLACGTEKGSFVAACAEVAIDQPKKQVRVIRAVTAFECGAILNPDHLKNQIEGSTIMGLGGALFERIDFADGKILNASFADYRLPRFRDAPALETVLLDRKDLPSEGAGETPIIAIAPAVGNAIFAASGIRLRSMPMIPDGLKK